MPPRAPGSVPMWLVALLLAACAPPADPAFQGYVEGDYLYLGAVAGGELATLHVERGQRVDAGSPLFQIDPEPFQLRLVELQRRFEQAQNRLVDLRKGSRPAELLALEARLVGARAASARADRELARRRALRTAGGPDAVSDEELDRHSTEVELRTAEIQALQAELDTARLGGREDAILVAEQEVQAQDAAVRLARWQLEQTRVLAPAAGVVQDTLYRPGEQVPAGRPVISLLPHDRVKLRFFVAQARLPGITPGDAVVATADGLPMEIPATVRFLSTEAEFTPPVIYSRESRQKLVFLVEAEPDAAAGAKLRVGQPVDIRLVKK